MSDVSPYVIQIGTFIFLTAFSLLLSWKQLKNPHDFRFTRFFAYECVLGLLLFNSKDFITITKTWREVFFWFGIGIAILLMLSSYVQLKRVAGSSSSIDTTHHFTDTGIYHWIRHPFYAGFIFFCLGIFFKGITIFNVILLILFLVLIFLTAKYEEKENLRKFGMVYRQYMQRTKMFVPYLI